MPPQLALIIILLFIGFVIYVEHKTVENISSAVWIIAIWILYSGSKGLGVFLNIQTTIEAGSWPDRYFLIALGMISLIMLLNRHFPLLEALQNNISVSIVLIYFLISASWSRDPKISIRGFGREAVALVIALLLCSENCPIKTLTSALKKAIYTALPLSILLIKYYPVYGRSYHRWTGELMWEGIASQKNGLAMICVLSILFFIHSLPQDLIQFRRVHNKFPVLINIFMMLLAFYLMMGPKRTLTYSATSFIALVVGLIFLIFVKATLKYGINIKNKFILVSILIILLGVMMPFSGKIPFKSVPKMLDRRENLTDRTITWNALIPYAKQHLLFGYGFGGFWTTSLRDQISSHAHNGYLDTILDLGIIGLSLFIIFIFILINKSFKFIHTNGQIEIFFISLILVLLIRNISEVSLGGFTNYSTWLLLAWSFIISRDKFILEKDLRFQEG